MKALVFLCLLGIASLATGASFPAQRLLPALSAPELDNLAVLAEKEELGALVSSAKKAGLVEVIATTKYLTLFGPNDEAFDTIPAPVAKLIEDVKVLREVLLYHVIKGSVYAGQIKNDLIVPSLSSQKWNIRFNIYKGGKVVTAQCSPIIKMNLNASNGVLHELSRVMIPPLDGTVTGLVSKETKYLSTLLKAVVTAGLQDLLNTAGPFTVFAPTNAAFAKIPEADLNKILQNKTLLTQILEYHVVSGTFCSAGLADGISVETLLKEHNVTIHVNEKRIQVNDANVVFADDPVTNGVVHIIDTVLIPKGVQDVLH